MHWIDPDYLPETSGVVDLYLLNAGGMATRRRSTGQIEEGPVGFSVAAVDGRCVSWRFQPLDRAWFFVPVTSPTDHRRLVTGPDRLLRAASIVRAKVGSDRNRIPGTRLGPNRNGRGW